MTVNAPLTSAEPQTVQQTSPDPSRANCMKQIDVLARSSAQAGAFFMSLRECVPARTRDTNRLDPQLVNNDAKHFWLRVFYLFFSSLSASYSLHIMFLSLLVVLAACYCNSWLGCSASFSCVAAHTQISPKTKPPLFCFWVLRFTLFGSVIVLH